MRIYNLFPLLAGKFSGWEPHLERAADMGFNWIFVNPIQRTGQSGSLYSIADYFDVNPLLVDHKSSLEPNRQLKQAIKAARNHGLHMMVDLVINHCAVDSNIVQQHPEWFVHDSQGQVVNPYCIDNGKKVVWGDLALFDHQHTRDPEGLYQFFYRLVEHLIDLGFEGFRCDAAYQLPDSQWRRLIGDVKQKHPHIIFAAETLGCSADETRKTAEAGFDYIFNSSKWWDFGSPWLMEQYNLTRATRPSISFPESHDTERLFAESQGSTATMKQRYLFAAMFSAGVMMPMGFEFGFRKRLHVVETRPEDWEQGEIDLCDFIRNTNEIKKKYPLFQEDSLTEILPHENPALLVMWKASTNAEQEALVIINKDTRQHQHFYSENLSTLVQNRNRMIDVSPEYQMEFLPAPFSYELRPGQGFVFLPTKDAG
jgi:starch synthase (maltosyl-transferring)